MSTKFGAFTHVHKVILGYFKMGFSFGKLL